MELIIAIAVILPMLAMLQFMQELGKFALRKAKESCMVYGFKEVDDRFYLLNPCPPQWEKLRRLSNIVSVELTEEGLLIKAETLTAMRDIVDTLNSTLPEQ